jgi:hypothetical protein
MPLKILLLNKGMLGIPFIVVIFGITKSIMHFVGQFNGKHE